LTKEDLFPIIVRIMAQRTRRSTNHPSDVTESAAPQNSYVMSAPASSTPTWLILALVVLAFFAGYYFAMSKAKTTAAAAGTTGTTAGGTTAPQQAPATSITSVKKPTTQEHWRGPQNTRFVWIEYSDLECPFCKREHPDLVKLMDEHKNDVAWVYRQYPLSFHPKAQKSAEAVECAAELGGNDAFWKMVDTITDKMPALELAGLPDVATSIGLDQTAFKTCLDSGKYAAAVKAQEDEGSKSGVQATPTNVIYDLQTNKIKVIEGALPYDSLKQSLDEFMKG
jgi:protein-disulfide isomerase